MKKVIIGVLALVVLLGAAFLYLMYRNRTMSPPGSETLTSGGVTVNVQKIIPLFEQTFNRITTITTKEKKR